MGRLFRKEKGLLKASVLVCIKMSHQSLCVTYQPNHEVSSHHDGQDQEYGPQKTSTQSFTTFFPVFQGILPSSIFLQLGKTAQCLKRPNSIFFPYGDVLSKKLLAY